jgi:hypothetical protein
MHGFSILELLAWNIKGVSNASANLTVATFRVNVSGSAEQTRCVLLAISQSQNYFTTGGLPPIISSWRAPI